MTLSHIQLGNKRNIKVPNISIEKSRNSKHIFFKRIQHILNNVVLARKLQLSMERKVNSQAGKYSSSETI